MTSDGRSSSGLTALITSRGSRTSYLDSNAFSSDTRNTSARRPHNHTDLLRVTRTCTTYCELHGLTASYSDLLRVTWTYMDLLLRQVVLLQIGVPSRSHVSEYRKLRGIAHQLVGRINGRFGAPGCDA